MYLSGTTLILWIGIVILWSHSILSANKCVRHRLNGPVPFPEPWYEHLRAFTLKYCAGNKDRLDSQGKGIYLNLQKWIQEYKNKTNTSDENPGALKFLEYCHEQYVALSTSGILSETKQKQWCKLFNVSQALIFFTRQFNFTSELEDIYNNSGIPGAPTSLHPYNISTVLSILPKIDPTDYGHPLSCRKYFPNLFFTCIVKTKCSGLANITVMPEAFVKMTRRLCKIIVDDIELNNDPNVKNKFEFDNLITDCKSESFFQGIVCLPYNRTLRITLQGYMDAYEKYKIYFEKHVDRILNNFKKELINLAKDLEKAHNFKMIGKDGSCDGSFNYIDIKERFSTYIESPVDGSFPFTFLAHYEDEEYKDNTLLETRDIVPYLKTSCDYSLDLICNEKCICECPNGKTCLPIQSLGTSSLSNEHLLIVLFITFILIA